VSAPRIGIQMCLDTQRRVRKRGPALYIATTYAEGIAAAGGVALHIPLQTDAVSAVDAVDGLLLPGGGDFLPSTPYPARVRFDAVPEAQLAFDRRLLQAALARRMPVLGVCYGMQLLALELGATLCYDLATDKPSAGPHQLGDDQTHELEWTDAASRLKTALASHPHVNSRHHQAVEDPGPRLRAVARSRDGVIEAIEAPDAPFCAGVQWHPEDALDDHGRRLFAALIEAARQQR